MPKGWWRSTLKNELSTSYEKEADDKDNIGKVYFERELPWEVEDIADCLAAFEHSLKRVDFAAGAMS